VKTTRKIAVTAVIACTAMTAAPAWASEEPGQSKSTVYEDRITDESAYGNIPIEVYEFATNVERANFTSAPSFSWDEATATLQVTVDDAQLAAQVDSAAAAAGLTTVEVAVSAYDKDALTAAAEDLADGGSIAGAPVSWAAPRADGSGLDVGVETATVAARAAGRAAFQGIPVTIVDVGEVEEASRNYDAGPEYIAGADMSSESPSGGNYIKVCSTSFAFGYRNGASYQERLFTADHCGGGPSATWHTGKNLSNPEIGNMSYVATNTDITSLAGKDYAPYMYHGDNNSNSAVAIRGYVTPIVGGFMCYSGAPSGSVCGNEITHTGVAASYGYNGLTRTVQYLGTPALGNGDSGGPAYAVTSQGYAYAIGVISGMSNASSTCTGDPGSSSRQCSAIGLFAPVASHFALNEFDYLQTVPLP
jgi:hypothetical protein